jgi:hypothetical protein
MIAKIYWIEERSIVLLETLKGCSLCCLKENLEKPPALREIKQDGKFCHFLFLGSI